MAVVYLLYTLNETRCYAVLLSLGLWQYQGNLDPENGAFVPIAPRLSKIVRIRVFVRTRLISVYHFSSMKQEFLQQPRSISFHPSCVEVLNLADQIIVCEYTPPGWAVLNINSFFKDIHANFVHIVRTCRLKTGTKQAAYWQIDTTIPFYAY